MGIISTINQIQTATRIATDIGLLPEAKRSSSVGFNINNMKSVITKRNGLTRTSHFRVIITAPPWIQRSGVGTGILQDIPLLCDSAALPGINLTTSEIRHLGYGAIERRPDVPLYTELPLTFLSTGDGEVLRFFHRWIQNVINVGTSDKASSSTTHNGAFLYETQYATNYRTTIQLYHYNEVGEQLLVYTFNDAYPIGVGDIPVSWSATDEIVRVPVQFVFTNWHCDTFEVGKIDNTRGSSMSILQKLTSVASVVATISNMRTPTSIMDAFNQVGNLKNVGRVIGGLF